MKRRSFLLGATALSTLPFLPKIEPASVPVEVDIVDLDMVWDPVSRTYRFIAGSNLTWLKDIVGQIKRPVRKFYTGNGSINAFDVPDSAQLGHVVAVQTHTETIMVPADSATALAAEKLNGADA